MPVFEYTGYDSGGKNVRGVVDADTGKTARAKLRKTGIYPTNLNESRRPASQAVLAATPVAERKTWRDYLPDPAMIAERITAGRGDSLSETEKAFLTRQLATMTSAGLTIVESFDTVIEQSRGGRLEKILAGMRGRIVEGGSVADAVGMYRSSFGEIYMDMIRAGEVSGALETVLTRLADMLEGEMERKRRLMAAMWYPAMMIFVSAGILVFLMTYVVPKVTAMFAELKAAVPLPTLILLALSKTLVGYWYIFAILASAGIVWAAMWFRTPQGKLWRDRTVLRVPLLGDLVLKSAVARFARTLSTLLAGGVPLARALDIVGGVPGNKVIEAEISAAAERIREGQSMSEQLKRGGYFPPLAAQMIAVGERTGELEPMLGKVAHVYEGEVSSAVTAMISVVEPAMIVMMGFIIGFIVIAILLPIFELTQSIR